MDDQDQQAHERSVALFGNRYFAHILDAFARLQAADEDITVRRLARELNLPDSVVRPVVLRLIVLGIVTPLPRTGGPRSKQSYVLEETTEAGNAVTAARTTALHVDAEPPKSPSRRS